MIGAAIFGPSTALADCKDEWICVDAINRGSNVELRAKNLREYPITYTLRIRTRDLTVTGYVDQATAVRMLAGAL